MIGGIRDQYRSTGVIDAVSDTVHTNVQMGAPLPQKLRPYLNQDLFFRIRRECFDARSKEDFDSVIDRWNLDPNIRGALEGSYVSHSLGEVCMDQLKMLGGLFIGGGIGGTKSLVEKQLSWHIPSLQLAQQAGNQGMYLPASNAFVNENAPPLVQASVLPSDNNAIPVVQGQVVDSNTYTR